jgi:hypothetical protein
MRAPGAALSAWKKIDISKTKRRFECTRDAGASVAIPLQWPESFSFETLDPTIADLLRLGLWQRWPGFFSIHRNGKEFEGVPTESPDATTNAWPSILSLRNLPVGKYPSPHAFERGRSFAAILSAVHW